ncbi:MAG: hypothetical protein IGS50_12460 [Synechococcales cyanobacterium C42_A2020_086]|jgi:uncharacterized membrane protein (UPF0182 family)|nr:hypothetical protein [Synechococcales cyanobacterium C42_A2020_086]
MKPVTLFWIGVAGCGGVVLLGHIFASYADLRAGVIRLLLLGAVGVAIAVALHVAAARHENPDLVFDRKPLIGLGVLVLILLLVGA